MLLPFLFVSFPAHNYIFLDPRIKKITLEETIDLDQSQEQFLKESIVEVPESEQHEDKSNSGNDTKL